MPLPKIPRFGGSPKALVPVVLVAVALGLGSMLMKKAQEIRQLARDLEASRQQINTLKNQHQQLTQELSSLQGDLKTRDDRVASLRTQLSTATADLERSETTRKELEERYAKLTGEREALQTQLASRTKERDDIKEKVQRFEQDNAELERAVNRSRERLALLDRDYRQLSEKLTQMEAKPREGLGIVTTVESTAPVRAAEVEEGKVSSSIAGTVELPPIIVRKDQAGMSIPIRGRILEINEPHSFIVVDQGSEDGVRVGMVFDVLRGAGAVGRATVVRVRPKLSACDIIRSKTPGSLQAGDLAVQSGP